MSDECWLRFGLKTNKEQLSFSCTLLECHQVLLTFRRIRWSVCCDFHCTYCLLNKMNWTSGNRSSLHIVGPSCQVVCSFSALVCLWENPLVTGSWCDIGTRTEGHVRLWTMFKVKGCLCSLMRSFYVTGEVPKALSASGLVWMRCVVAVFIWFPLVKAIPVLSVSHPRILTPKRPMQRDNPTVMLNFYSHLQQGSMFPFSFLGIISVPVASWSFQLPLFQFGLPGASGNNETVGHGKIISLLSVHIEVLLTHDPGLSTPSVHLLFDV